jgi:predicted  nucleic acid-binding Zn-ribbon protein
MDDVKRDATKSLTTTATYSQQEKDKLLAAMQTQLEAMEANIEKLRLKGKDLASDTKSSWELKMAALEQKRETAKEKIAEISKSTSQAWSDIEKCAKTAWEDLSKAFLEASKEFENTPNQPPEEIK